MFRILYAPDDPPAGGAAPKEEAPAPAAAPAPGKGKDEPTPPTIPYERFQQVVGERNDFEKRLKKIETDTKKAQDEAAAKQGEFKGLYEKEQADHANEVLMQAQDLVSFGEVKDFQAALRKLGKDDPTGASLARRAKQAGSNPARKRFRTSHPLFARFYSDIAGDIDVAAA